MVKLVVLTFCEICFNQVQIHLKPKVSLTVGDAL